MYKIPLHFVPVALFACVALVCIEKIYNMEELTETMEKGEELTENR